MGTPEDGRPRPVFGFHRPETGTLAFLDDGTVLLRVVVDGAVRWEEQAPLPRTPRAAHLGGRFKTNEAEAPF